MINSQTKTDGWIWPVVDYGKIDNDTTVAVDVRYMRPGFFLKTMVDIIVGNVGYKSAGSLLQDPLYQKLIVQFANDNFEHSTDAQQVDQYSATVQTSLAQTVAYDNKFGRFDGTLPFQLKITDPSNAFSFQENTFIAPADMEATVEFAYGLKFTATTKKDINKSNVQVFFQIAGPGYATFERLVHNEHDTDQGVNDYKLYLNQKLSVDISFKKGQRLIVGYIFSKLGGKAIFSQEATFSVKNKNQQVLYKHNIQCERIFPDISQKDLLKDTLQRFGIICQTDNTARTVTFASLRDIVNNIPNAND